jgi:hypothetical protein
MNWLTIAIIVVIILVIIYYITKSPSLEDAYKQLDGYNDPNAEIFEQVLASTDARPIDLYRAGEVNVFHLGRHHTGVEIYHASLDNALFYEEDEQFIIDRVRDTARMINDDNLFNHANIAQDVLTSRVLKPSSKKKSEKKTKSAKSIDKKQEWHYDGQNVHDSNITSQLKEQYDYIKDDKLTIAEAKNMICSSGHPKAVEAAESLIFMCEDRLCSTIGDQERNVPLAVLARVNDPINKSRKKDVLNSIIDSLVDCKNHNGFVCQTGRITRVIGALHCVDNDDMFQKFQSKEAIRNEIYDRVSKQVDKIIQQQPTDVQKAYNNNEEKYKEEIDGVNRDIRDSIDVIIDDYRDKLDDKQLKKIKSDCVQAL